MKNRNPFDLCTLDDSSDCGSCDLTEKISCKWDKKKLNVFLTIGFPPFILAIFGMVVVGIMTHAWWPLISYIAFLAVIFGWEIRFLCSHCPYYAEDSKILHCLGNNGAYKFFAYNPAPITKFGKFMMAFLVATVFFVYPLAVTGYGIGYMAVNSYSRLEILGMTGITIGCLVTSLIFFIVLKLSFCSTCINFSCVNNTVPKNRVDDYLKKNPVMKEAWEKSGYKID
ncbi:hypothetical protein ACFLXE_01825 [Chloroflexota bacterium]